MKYHIFLLFLGCIICSLSAAFPQSFEGKALTVKPVKYDLTFNIDFDAGILNGTCLLTLMNSSAEPVNTIPLELYRLMKVKSISDGDGRILNFNQNVVSYEDFEKLQVNYIEAALNTSLESGDTTSLVIDYSGHLLGYSETGMSYIKDRIDPGFTIIRPDSRAYPLIGVPRWEVNYKAGLPEFDYKVTITVPDTLASVNPGILTSKNVRNNLVTYVYRSAQPAWRIDIAVADYGILENGEQRIFYLKEDSCRAREVMAAMNRTIKLYSSWFGPLYSTNHFSLIEIPDGFGSQTTSSCIIQSAGAFKDDKRLYELYHEVSHLWNVPKTDSQPPRWEEGLAMFLQYLTVEKIENRPVISEVMQKTAERLRKTFEKNKEYLKIPVKDYGKKDVTRLSYSAGMLFFYTLYTAIGEQNFLNIMGDFYQKYYKTGASTEEFINYIKNNTEADLSGLFNEWFYEPVYAEYIMKGLSVDQIIMKYKQN